MIGQFWHDSRLMNLLAGSLTLLSAVFVLFQLAAWVSKQPVFQIKQVELIGDVARVNLKGFEASVLPGLQQSFFEIELSEAKELVEAQPWIRRATLQRRWPDTLVIDLQTHSPLALWGEAQLLNTYGEVFVANLAEAGELGGLPNLSGPVGSELLVARMYLKLSQELREVGLKAQTVNLSERYGWSVRTESGIELAFGRDSAGLGIEKKLDRFKRIYPRLVGTVMKSLWRVDLRYPQGLAVKGEKVEVGSTGRAS